MHGDNTKQHVSRTFGFAPPFLITGAIEFYIEAKKAGISQGDGFPKPVLGVELRTTSEQAVLLAKDYAGYITLCEMVTKLCEEYPAARPLVREEETEISPKDSLRRSQSKEILTEKRGCSESVNYSPLNQQLGQE